MSRVAAAPISWGVCEVPDWGHQMDAERVLSEMAGIGVAATELGPAGFLPSRPEDARRMLERHGVHAVGGFVPAVLHVPERLPAQLELVERAASAIARAGGGILVVAAALGGAGYEGRAGSAARVTLDRAGWTALGAGLIRTMEIAERHGIRAVLHPHHGTLIDGLHQVEEVLERCAVALCLDTGHLALGGADPLRIVRQADGRIAHVHLKDVDADLAAGVREGRIGYHEAVARGMYRVLGEGDVKIREVVEILEDAGYGGWYVLEQDCVLDGEPADGDGPRISAARSLGYMGAWDAA